MVYEVLKMVSVFMGVMVIIFIVFLCYFVMFFLFLSDFYYYEVFYLVSIYFFIVGISEVFFGWVFVFSGVLRGVGDMKSLMYVMVISKFLFRIVFFYVFGFGFVVGFFVIEGMGVIVVWFVMIFEMFMSVVMYWWIFKKGRWKYVKV